MKFVHTRKYVVQASLDDDLTGYFDHIEGVEPKNNTGSWVIEIPLVEAGLVRAYDRTVDAAVAQHLRTLHASWSVVETASHRPENPFILVDLSDSGPFSEPDAYGELVDMITKHIAGIDGGDPLVYVEEYENLPSVEQFDVGTVIAVNGRAEVHGYLVVPEAADE